MSSHQHHDSTSAEERRRRFEAIAAEIYEPLQRYLRRRASFHDADDVFEETLMTIWRRLDDVPADAVLPWSYGVAKRALANHRRSVRRQGQLVDRLKRQPHEQIQQPLGTDASPELAAALERLSVADREMLRLWAWEDLEPREIAVVLGSTANAVSLRLTRAKKKLAHEMERQIRLDAGHRPVEHTKERPR
ncbi:MAG: RNA polymerase sigma factor [Acidimicrobiia bacterium]|nr:RNA polymerase sigma factor [Acidimicrobiia bacterium]